jgi:hypothetical protein
MEMLNFSVEETSRIKRALRYIPQRELDFERLSDRTVVIKSEHFADECKQIAAYFPEIGLENGQARLVFNTARAGQHKILINKATIAGLSFIPTLVTELVHLGNLSSYQADHGNIYRFDPEQALAEYYYEFLLWTKFQATKLATRVYALVTWHEINGEAAPLDGCYQFTQPDFSADALMAVLQVAQQAHTKAARWELLWNVLEELAVYLGRLALYQQEARPSELDEYFPAVLLAEIVGLENCLNLYASLLRAQDYAAWLDERQGIRKAVAAMQRWGEGG